MTHWHMGTAMWHDGNVWCPFHWDGNAWWPHQDFDFWWLTAWNGNVDIWRDMSRRHTFEVRDHGVHILHLSLLKLKGATDQFWIITHARHSPTCLVLVARMAENALSSSEIPPEVCNKVVLVCRGEEKKPVSFSSDGAPRKRQMKNEQWDGFFVGWHCRGSC